MTLRARLSIAFVLVGVAIVVAGAVVVNAQRRYLIDQLDRQLLTAGIPAARFAGPQPDGQFPPPGGTGRSIPLDLFDLYVARIAANGSVTGVIVPGHTGSGSPRLTATDVRAALLANEPRTVTARSHDGSYRVVVLRARDGSLVVVGLSLDRVDSVTTRLIVAVTIAGLLIIAVLLLGSWWVARLGLRPIRHMTEAADAIARGELDRRVQHPSVTTEAGRLGHAFNVMLDERQAAEQRVRRFAADASHELRTPLTSILGYADLFRRGGLAEPQQLDDAMRRIGQEAQRMAALVEDLLLLARLDEGRPLERATVDAALLLHDAVNDAHAVQPQRRFEAEIAERLAVVGDEHRLRQVVAGLVSNAMTHTDGGATITVRGWAERDSIVIEVADDGEGMDAELAAHAFDRFVRGDPGRSRHRGGAGLGLSVVAAVVDAHGGRVTLDTAPGRGTRVRVVLATTRGATPDPDSQVIPSVP